MPRLGRRAQPASLDMSRRGQAIEAENIFGGPGSDAHMASIAGARAGGALKDVAAPSVPRPAPPRTCERDAACPISTG